LEQYRDEGRRGAVARDVRQVETDPMLVDPEVIDEISRQVQRRDDLVRGMKVVGGPGRHRQHVHLYLAPGILVFLKTMEAGLRVAIRGFQLLAIAAVAQP